MAAAVSSETSDIEVLFIGGVWPQHRREDLPGSRREFNRHTIGRDRYPGAPMLNSPTVSDDQVIRRVFKGATLVASGYCIALAILLLIFPLLRATYLVAISRDKGWSATHALRDPYV